MYVAARMLLKSRQIQRLRPMVPKREDTPCYGTGQNDLYLCLRPLLLFGQCIGLVPYSGLLRTDLHRVTFRRTSWRVIMTALIGLSLCSNIVISMMGVATERRNTLPEVVWISRPIIFYSVGVFGYCYMFVSGEKLLKLMQQWQSMRFSFNDEDPHLRRDTLLVVLVIYTSAILENALQQSIQMSLLDLSRFRRGINGTLIPEGEGMGVWETYFNNDTQPKWSALFPYNMPFAILVFLWNKCSLYGWNFNDIFLIIFSRAVYHKFKLLARHTYTSIVQPLTDVRQKTVINAKEQWLAVTSDFEQLYLFLEGAKKFLSPMVFVSYGANLYFLIIHIHMGITPVKNTQGAASIDVYRTWALIHLVTRMFLLTLNASRMADYSEDFIRLYRKCPTECYSVKIKRMESFAKSNKCCLSGLNCFYVTKPFMLSLVGVVFTFEIVLLQASGFGYYWGVAVPN